MYSCNGVATFTSRPRRTTAPFQYSNSLGFPSAMSRCKDVVPCGGGVEKLKICFFMDRPRVGVAFSTFNMERTGPRVTHITDGVDSASVFLLGYPTKRQCAITGKISLFVMRDTAGADNRN
jgi:hypothetical protein